MNNHYIYKFLWGAGKGIRSEKYLTIGASPPAPDMKKLLEIMQGTMRALICKNFSTAYS